MKDKDVQKHFTRSSVICLYDEKGRIGNECFKQSILTYFGIQNNIYEKNRGHQEISQINSHPEIKRLFNDEGIIYPFSLTEENIKNVEKNNPDIALNLICDTNTFGVGKEKLKTPQPLYISPQNEERKYRIYLIFLEKYNHFGLIKDINKYNSSYRKNKKKCGGFTCYCLNWFQTEGGLKFHQQNCGMNKAGYLKAKKLIFPEKGKNLLSFLFLPDGKTLNYKNLSKKLEVPMFAVGDYESINIKNMEIEQATFKKTEKNIFEATQIPYYCRFFIVGKDQEIQKLIDRILKEKFSKRNDFYFEGKNVQQDVIDFIFFLNEFYEYVTKINNRDEDDIQKHLLLKAVAKNCHICELPLDVPDEIVLDHDHLTGRFRGFAHNDCNMVFKLPSNISLFYHNGKNYDNNFMLTAFANRLDKTRTLPIKVIPQSLNKFLSITMGCVQIKDSRSFMNGSLSALCENTPFDCFANTQKILSEKYGLSKEACEASIKKNIMAYDWFDDPKKMDFDGLPPLESFKNQLAHDISEKEYNDALQLFEKLGFKIFGE